MIWSVSQLAKHVAEAVEGAGCAMRDGREKEEEGDDEKERDVDERGERERERERWSKSFEIVPGRRTGRLVVACDEGWKR